MSNVPVEAASELGNVVLAVDVSAPLGPEPHSLVDVALRAYDITARTLQAYQIRIAQEKLGENFLLIRPEVGHMAFWSSLACLRRWKREGLRPKLCFLSSKTAVRGRAFPKGALSPHLSAARCGGRILGFPRAPKGGLGWRPLLTTLDFR